MANPERATQLEIFPIDRSVVQEGVYWAQANLTSEQKRKEALDDLKQKSPEVHSITRHLKEFRTRTHLDDDHKEAYDNGVLFMFNTLEEKYRKLGLEMPHISPELGQAHTLDLIDTERNPSKINKFMEELKSRKSGKNKALLPRITSKLASEQKRLSSRKLTASFNKNSNDKVNKMHNEEKFLGEALTHKNLIKVLGPYEGINLGAMDVYELVRREEDFQPFKKAWDVEVK